MSINKVVLEHSHAHLFMNCVCAFMLQQQRWVRSRSGDGGGALPVAAQELQIAVMHLQFDSVSRHHAVTFKKITNAYQNKKRGLWMLFNQWNLDYFTNFLNAF